MEKLLAVLNGSFSSGRSVELIYAGKVRECIVELIAPTYVKVKQLNWDGGYRTFSLENLELSK